MNDWGGAHCERGFNQEKNRVTKKSFKPNFSAGGQNKTDGKTLKHCFSLHLLNTNAFRCSIQKF